MIITNDNGVLRIDAPTLDQFEVPYDTTVTPYTKDHVYWNVQGYPFLMGFIRDDNDQVTYFANRYFVATRAEDIDTETKCKLKNSATGSPQTSGAASIYSSTKRFLKGTVFTSGTPNHPPH